MKGHGCLLPPTEIDDEEDEEETELEEMEGSHWHFTGREGSSQLSLEARRAESPPHACSLAAASSCVPDPRHPSVQAQPSEAPPSAHSEKDERGQQVSSRPPP